jgi:uncharacterized protein YndB with AHSA1/START domain
MAEHDPKAEAQILRMDTTVKRAPQEVQDYVANLQHLEQWWPEHWRYRRLSGDGGPGTRYYWIVATTGVILPGITRIETLDPGRLSYRTAMAGLPIRMNYEFLPSPEGTLVRAEMNSAGLRLSLFRKAVGKQMGHAMTLLRQALA